MNKKEKTGKEMMEELGFVKVERQDCWEAWVKYTNQNIRYIEFELNKRFIVPRDINYEFITLQPNELKAIYKICKEKGWNNGEK